MALSNAQSLNASIDSAIMAVVERGVIDLVNAAADRFRSLVRGFENQVVVDVVINADLSATVTINDSVQIGSQDRIKALDEGIPAYRQPSNKRPMPIPIGYTRKTVPGSLEGRRGSRATNIIFRYYRGPIEPGRWEAQNAKITRETAQETFDAAVRKAR